MARARGTIETTVARRFLAGVAVVFLFLAPALSTGHHHENESDTSPCLVCLTASAPAVETAGAGVFSVADVCELISFPTNEPCVLAGSAGARAIRAPPSC